MSIVAMERFQTRAVTIQAIRSVHRLVCLSSNYQSQVMVSRTLSHLASTSDPVVLRRASPASGVPSLLHPLLVRVWKNLTCQKSCLYLSVLCGGAHCWSTHAESR